MAHPRRATRCRTREKNRRPHHRDDYGVDVPTDANERRHPLPALGAVASPTVDRLLRLADRAIAHRGLAASSAPALALLRNGVGVASQAGAGLSRRLFLS